MAANLLGWQCQNDNRNQYKYVCTTTYQPDTKSNHDPNLNRNPTTKQHAIVNIQLLGGRGLRLERVAVLRHGLFNDIRLQVSLKNVPLCEVPS